MALARCYLHIGDREAALSYLEMGFEYVCHIEEYYCKAQQIDNPIFRGKELSCSDDEYYGRFEMKDYMNGSWFDSVRENERFVAIYEQL